MTHQEIMAIAQLVLAKQGKQRNEDFARGFLDGVHYMEILHEIRLSECTEQREA